MRILGDTVIEHIGVKRRSGRYPWGSGEHPFGGLHDVISKRQALIKAGVPEGEVWKRLGYSSTNQYRKAVTIANNERKEQTAHYISEMKKQGYNNSEIARALKVSEGTVRYQMSHKDKIAKSQLNNTTQMLKDKVKEGKYIDVGKGVEAQLGISRHKLNAALDQLEAEGYSVHKLFVKQAASANNYTDLIVLTKEKNIDIVRKHKTEVTAPDGYTPDGGLTYKKFKRPEPVKWNEVGIRYRENGGEDRDGLIQVRPGVDGLDLGTSHYAQVRINVGGTHYLKGMAVYSNDLPAGKNLVFNTNKSKKTPKEKVLKELKDTKSKDPSTMFGALITKQKGKFNIVNEEGSWLSWNGSRFPSQFLSKQPTKLIKERVQATLKKKKQDLDDILALTNPVIKKQLLDDYASKLQSSQKELKLQGLPRTQAHVLIPFPKMKPNEIYAPNYKNGERVVLIRYPHAGTFEIPELRVNNKFSGAKKLLGSALDAVGIHPSVAHKLSGADFDGDAVYVIPNNKKKIKTTSSLKGLKDFDPNSYAYPDGVPHKKITNKLKQNKMGDVSNLIADMTVKGASIPEITRAVKHSMVIIDSEKHDLNWRQSEKDNRIPELRKKYQDRKSLKYDPVTQTIKEGAFHLGGSTLMTRANAEITVGDKRTVTVDRVTKKIKPKANPKPAQTYTKKDASGKTIIDKKTGKPKVYIRKDPVKVPILDVIKDAKVLSSGTSKEKEYVTYINTLKSYSNRAQKEAASLKMGHKNKNSTTIYKEEVASLMTKLKTAEANAPRERKAQIMANDKIMKAMRENKDMTGDQLKKVKRIALNDARIQSGAKRYEIDITPKEWEAIQARAIAPSTVSKIFLKADNEKVMQYATPKVRTSMATGKVQRAKALLASGYTYAEVANVMGVSVSTLHNNIH